MKKMVLERTVDEWSGDEKAATEHGAQQI